MPQKTKERRCSNCGKPVRRVQGNYRFRESGLSNVVLKNIDILECGDCGNHDPIVPRPSEMLTVLASAIAKKPCPLDGEEVRFLRKYADMTAETFASYIGADKTTISKWENNQIPIGTISDRLIRAVFLGLGPGSKEQIQEGIRNFAAISAEPKAVRIELDVRILTVEYA